MPGGTVISRSRDHARMIEQSGIASGKRQGSIDLLSRLCYLPGFESGPRQSVRSVDVTPLGILSRGIRISFGSASVVIGAEQSYLPIVAAAVRDA